jgi:hypothetical protein
MNADGKKAVIGVDLRSSAVLNESFGILVARLTRIPPLGFRRSD